MIGRALKFTRGLVDDAAFTSGDQWLTDQDVVDAHAHIAAKRHHPVIPPAESLFGLIEQAVTILQTQRL